MTTDQETVEKIKETIEHLSFMLNRLNTLMTCKFTVQQLDFLLTANKRHRDGFLFCDKNQYLEVINLYNTMMILQYPWESPVE